MSWFWWATLATGSFALANIADKILLLRFAKSTDTAIKMLGFFSLLFFAGAYFLSPSIHLEAFPWLPFLAGVFEIAFIYYYFRAIEDEMVAYVVPVFSLSPVLVALGGMLFGQTLSLLALAGIAGTVIAIILLVKAKEGKIGLSWGSALSFIIISTVLYSIYAVMLDATLHDYTLWQSISWSRLGVFAGALGYMFVARSKSLKAFVTPITYIFVVSEILYLLTVYLSVVAFEEGDAASVVAVMNSQPIFVFAVSYILWKISPKILQEKFSFNNPRLAVFSIVLLFGALYLLNF